MALIIYDFCFNCNFLLPIPLTNTNPTKQTKTESTTAKPANLNISKKDNKTTINLGSYNVYTNNHPYSFRSHG